MTFVSYMRIMTPPPSRQPAVHSSWIRRTKPATAAAKNGSAHSYMTLEDGVFTWKDLSGAVYHTLAL